MRKEERLFLRMDFRDAPESDHGHDSECNQITNIYTG